MASSSKVRAFTSSLILMKLLGKSHVLRVVKGTCKGQMAHAGCAAGKAEASGLVEITVTLRSKSKTLRIGQYQYARSRRGGSKINFSYNPKITRGRTSEVSCRVLPDGWMGHETDCLVNPCWRWLARPVPCSVGLDTLDWLGVANKRAGTSLGF